MSQEIAVPLLQIGDRIRLIHENGKTEDEGVIVRSSGKHFVMKSDRNSTEIRLGCPGNPMEYGWKTLHEDPFQDGVWCYSQRAPSYKLERLER